MIVHWLWNHESVVTVRTCVSIGDWPRERREAARFQAGVSCGRLPVTGTGRHVSTKEKAGRVRWKRNSAGLNSRKVLDRCEDLTIAASGEVLTFDLAAPRASRHQRFPD